MAKKLKLSIALKRILILSVSIVVGGAIVATSISKKQPPERVVAVEIQRSVQVIETSIMPFTIEASGFGTAAPDQTWSAVSNVKGHIIYRHENLESGEILPKGAFLLEIDPAFYQLAIAEANAEIASIDTEIAQLKQEAANAEILLELESQRLELAEIDLERTRTLLESGAVPQANLDTQLRATLQQRQAVQALINQQNIIPIQLNRLDAQKERAISKRAQVESDLEDTKIYAPFDMRIGEVHVEMYQYINPGQALFVGDGIETAEVVLQVPMQNLRRVLSELSGDEMDVSNINAEVQLVAQDQTWDAEVIRIANGIDQATRTVRVVLSVDQPESYDDMLDNPPLPKGMYVQGTLRVAAEPQLVVPQEALHEGWVYLVDADNRLERREVEVSFKQNGMVVILSGLQAGETVILDDIVPAVSGTLLAPERNSVIEQTLRSNAAGATQ